MRSEESKGEGEGTAAPPNEGVGSDPMPVFVIKAKDNLAPAAVFSYATLVEGLGLYTQAKQTRLALNEIVAWRERNPSACKWPDHKHVPAAELDADILHAALLNVERSARELDGLFDKCGTKWMLGRHSVSTEVAGALLSLHDYLNDVESVRSDDPELRAALRVHYERVGRAR